jgi:hypothetical protein
MAEDGGRDYFIGNSSGFRALHFAFFIFIFFMCFQEMVCLEDASVRHFQQDGNRSQAYSTAHSNRKCIAGRSILDPPSTPIL